MSTIQGKAWKYGDDVDTDVIIPARYLVTGDPGELGKHCMEDLDASFVSSVSPGDLLVGGENFGCGSSREHAPLAIKGAGCGGVIAKSFARIFFRNAINVGLPILECPEAAEEIESGDLLSVDTEKGIITNLTRGTSYEAAAFPPFLSELIGLGGLVPYVRKKLEESGQ
ncbi:MAG TPA: 3-isopropylmalate dehydratase small subunit [Synergistaceae bacterium]|nr:3-isopropylmalate dehydratase small subunit [Synergistaceae bacterium]HPJ25675.1 3-isopropylmalate dehydratase small subunit [Synergistaceae bacterium]HPQ36888.1 3-isopropylmalate dehydratase small subunit [Synergistaceae bacterium]